MVKSFKLSRHLNIQSGLGYKYNTGHLHITYMLEYEFQDLLFFVIQEFHNKIPGLVIFLHNMKSLNKKC